MIKPDGVQRGLVSEIVGRFERKGFRIQGLKMFQCSEELAKEHYKVCTYIQKKERKKEKKGGDYRFHLMDC